MPNINAEVHASATLLTFIGNIYWVKDDKILDIRSILASSGPAYVFYLMDAQLSDDLLTQTFLGSAKLAQQKTDAFTTIMESVISPKAPLLQRLISLLNTKLGKALKKPSIMHGNVCCTSEIR